MTVHESAVQSYALTLMRDPEAAPVLADVWERLRRATIQPWFTNIVGQPDPRTGWPIEQAAALMWVMGGLGSGKFAQVGIELGEGPHSDRAGREQNAAVIADLPAPFIGQVDPDQSTSPYGDGTIGWTDRISVDRLNPDADPVEFTVGSTTCIPLEIGSTKASVTAMHLAQSGAVARWPYGSTALTLIVDLALFDSVPSGSTRSHTMRGAL